MVGVGFKPSTFQIGVQCLTKIFFESKDSFYIALIHGVAMLYALAHNYSPGE